MSSTAPEFGIKHVVFVLFVQDMQRAAAFYRGALGCKFGFESPHWTEMTVGPGHLALHHGGKGGRTETGICIEVSGIQAACDAIAAHGGTVLQAPQARPQERITIAQVCDTEGNQFSLVEPLNR